MSKSEVSDVKHDEFESEKIQRATRVNTSPLNGIGQGDFCIITGRLNLGRDWRQRNR